MRREGTKSRFSIGIALRRIRNAIEHFPKAALFELAISGHKSTFEQLVACMISIRTRDEVTVPTARKLFAVARTPQQVARLTVRRIDGLIHACSFHLPKAKQIREIAQQAVSDYNGKVPCDESVLLSFRGVGPKCANLVLGIACGQPRVGVDIHVHRVTNRWGYVSERQRERCSHYSPNFRAATG
jgi:endonuclease-3